MAEARSAVSYRDQPSNLSFVINDEEIVLRISKNAFPSFITSIKRSIERSIIRTRNAIINAFYPAPPAQWAILVATPAAAMTSDHPSLAPIHEFLWQFDRYLPSASWLPRVGRVGIISACAGTVMMLGFSYVRSIILRALLSYQGWLYEGPRETSRITMIWGLLVKLVSGRHRFGFGNATGLLYSNQRALPKLPVPKLEDTCRRYLRSVRPILNDEEYAKMESLVERFKKNEGRKLQRYAVLKSWFTENYVADWWEKYVYLRGRSPIVINSNYYILDSKKSYAPTRVPAARAANLIWEILNVRYLVERELLPPMVIRNTVPMCMKQYERAFSTTRIPGKEIDSLKHWDDSRHIVVLRRGRYYVADMYHEDGSLMSVVEIENQLQWIIHHADAQPELTEAEQSIAAFTCENRTEWAKAREEHFSSGVNKHSLNMIDSAIFFVSLDHEIPTGEGYDGQARSLFHGDGTNRWVDKSFCLVVFPDGRMGLHVEHSWADAPVIAHLFELCIQVGEPNGRGYDENGLNKRVPGMPIRAVPPPRQLRWDFTFSLEKAVLSAKSNVRKLIDDLDLHVLGFNNYGKNFMKHCGISPDAYVQIALQVAYYKESSSFALTYESSMTRLFLHGRTETVRPVSIESAAFVRAFYDPSVPAEEKLRLLKKAGDVHQNAYRDAMTGKGVDRHLFALYVLSQGLGIKSEFLNSALSMPWKLSTSQQPQNQSGLIDPKKAADLLSPGGGFGPVADEGYGISYMVAGEDDLFFHISSKKSCPETDSKRFGDRIVEALIEMQNLVKSAKKKSS